MTKLQLGEIAALTQRVNRGGTQQKCLRVANTTSFSRIWAPLWACTPGAHPRVIDPAQDSFTEWDRPIRPSSVVRSQPSIAKVKQTNLSNINVRTKFLRRLVVLHSSIVHHAHIEQCTLAGTPMHDCLRRMFCGPYEFLCAKPANAEWMGAFAKGCPRTSAHPNGKFAFTSPGGWMDKRGEALCTPAGFDSLQLRMQYTYRSPLVRVPIMSERRTTD
eukprot:2371901-Amphidinium_carterae.2